VKFPLGTFDLDLHYIMCVCIQSFKTVQHRFEVSSGISSKGEPSVSRVEFRVQRETIHLSLVIDPVPSNPSKTETQSEGEIGLKIRGTGYTDTDLSFKVRDWRL
jgi:hypothetical protein